VLTWAPLLRPHLVQAPGRRSQRLRLQQQRVRDIDDSDVTWLRSSIGHEWSRHRAFCYAQRACVGGRHRAHQTFIPPSTTMSTPVTYELSAEARNRATFATSSGRPRRPSNVLPIMARAHSGSLSCSRVWFVSISPGEIELARIPHSAPPWPSVV